MRIKSFQRICFIIYSGEAEKYVNKERLKVLLEKIKNVLKEESAHPNLVILILFSLRILILRLRKETLNGLFKTIWSSILFLLENMIRSSKWEKRGEFNNVIIAALKLLELISCSDIDEFNLHKWAFVYEYFGVQLENTADTKATEQKSPFLVNPILLKKTPMATVVRISSDAPKELALGSKRRILFIENRMEQARLESKVLEFLTYVTILASANVELDREEIESLIQGDFIEFSNFINL